MWLKGNGVLIPAGYGISGKHDEFTHGVQHPHLATEEGSSCLWAALAAQRWCWVQRGWRLWPHCRDCVPGALGFHSPWRHLNFRTCCAILLRSLLSPTPNLQAPQICFENGHWGFLNMNSSGWGHCCRTDSAKTLFQDSASSQFIVFSSSSPTATMKRGFEVIECNPCCHKGCLSGFAFYSSSSYRICLCFEAFPCPSHPTRVVITSTLRRCINQSSPKGSSLTLLFNWLFMPISPLLPFTAE